MGKKEAADDDTRLFADLFVTTAHTIFQSVNLKSLNLTSLSLMTMMLIYSHSGITMSELAEAVGVSNAQLSRTVGKLEDRGLVERKHNANNRRIVNVFQTKLGQTMANEQVAIVRDNIRGHLSKLNDAERRELSAHFLASITLLTKAGLTKHPTPHDMDEAVFGRKFSGSHPAPPEL